MNIVNTKGQMFVKKAVKIIIEVVLGIALLVCSVVFLGSNQSRVEDLFNKTIETLDKGESVESLFNTEAKDKAANLDVDCAALSEFYQGKSVEVKNFDIFHETGNVYRAYGVVVTDKGEYFVCIGATGARAIDEVGIKQFIIEDNKTFKKKDLIKRKIMNKYEKKADEYGITIRMKGDKR